jgi:hypothetical protein
MFQSLDTKRSRIITTPLATTESSLLGAFASPLPTFAEKIEEIHEQSLPRVGLSHKLLNEWRNHQIRHDIPAAILRVAVAEWVEGARLGHPFYNEIIKLGNLKPANTTERPREHHVCTMDKLPSIILSSIFSFLEPCQELIGKCMLVSRYWFKVVPLPSSCLVWHDNNPTILLKYIHRIAPLWLPNIRSLTCFGGYTPRLHSFLHGTTLHRLTSLTVEGPSDPSTNSNVSIMTANFALTNLKQLKLVSYKGLDLIVPTSVSSSYRYYRSSMHTFASIMCFDYDCTTITASGITLHSFTL